MKDETKQILDKLFSLHRFGIKPGLERTSKLLASINHPQNDFKSIHVAGTNGKGSVCTFLASILAEAGYNVGLYTSPHLLRFNERFQINGEFISDEEIVELSKLLLPSAEKINATFFEITTAMAFKWFSDLKIDIAVIETGMGGRFDSTNVITPVLSVITSIALDHSEYLGSTIDEIAFEKAGIIKSRVPVVVEDSKKSLTLNFQEISNIMESELIISHNKYKILTKKFNSDFSMKLKFSDKSGNIVSIISPIAGVKQTENIRTVIVATDTLNNTLNISKENISNGILNAKSNFYFRGRIELISKEPMIVLDVAHNPDSINNLVKTLINSGYKNEKWSVVFAVMADKDIQSILFLLKSITSHLILTRPKIERAAHISHLKSIAQAIGYKKVYSFNNVNDAINFAPSLNDKILITGSFYLAAEVLQYIYRGSE